MNRRSRINNCNWDMKPRIQLVGWLMALGMSAAVAAPCLAQGPRANWAQNRQDNKPPKEQRQQQRQEQRQERRQPQQGARRSQNERQNSGANRPPNSNANRAEIGTRPSNNPNRPPSAYTLPPRRDFNSLSPQEKRKVLQDNRRLQNLPPAQRQELQERAQVWNKPTPEQRQHIRNDVRPRRQQLPPDRRGATPQRLIALTHMPDVARNQWLQ